VSAPLTPAPFPVVRPCDLRASAASTTPWLIDQLWTAQAVGIIGGTPKSYKTWVALEMAVAVASGSACLATFAVPSPGPVLLYAAEDSEAALRLRLESLAQHHRLDLASLDIRVITTDSLRLDRTTDQERLAATLIVHRPALLILDPLVRLHAIDENAAGEIAALLGYLRLLQRKTGVAIALVHLSRVGNMSELRTLIDERSPRSVLHTLPWRGRPGGNPSKQLRILSGLQRCEELE